MSPAPTPSSAVHLINLSARTGWVRSPNCYGVSLDNVRHSLPTSGRGCVLSIISERSYVDHLALKTTVLSLTSPTHRPCLCYRMVLVGGIHQSGTRRRVLSNYRGFRSTTRRVYSVSRHIVAMHQKST